MNLVPVAYKSIRSDSWLNFRLDKLVTFSSNNCQTKIQQLSDD